MKSVKLLKLWVEQDPAGFTRHRILGGDAANPTTELAALKGQTSWGQLLDIRADWNLRYLRIETEKSPSWVA